MKLAIVDDEKKWQEAIRDLVIKLVDWEKAEIDVFISGESFLEKNIEYDIVFMDIEMGKLNGFETTKRYKAIFPDTTVIITTTYAELSRMGYKVNAFRYIDKMEMNEEIPEAFHAYKEKMKLSGVVELNTIYGVKQVRITDIIFFEKGNKKTIVHCKEISFECYETIKLLEEKMKDHGFYKTHRAYLVNLRYVKNYDKKDIIMAGDKKVYLSRRRYEEFNNKYLEFRYCIAGM